MTQPEFQHILSLLDEIRLVVVDRYNIIYMPRFNALGGKQMLPLPEPILWHGKSLPLANLDRAIQETNRAYIYQLNNAVTYRATLPQNMHENYGFEDRVIDGINYMADLTNAMVKDPKIRIAKLAYRVKADKILDTLTAILEALQTL